MIANLAMRVVPGEYRRWIQEIGVSGAGPGNGFFEPGTWDLGGGAKPWKRRYGPLGKAFPYTAEVSGHKRRLPGAMPLVGLGCGTVVLLVTAGPEVGRIWVDDRNSPWRT